MVPFYIFNCAQFELFSKESDICLNCVCDVIKTVVPLVPCESGQITIDANGDNIASFDVGFNIDSELVSIHLYTFKS